MFEADVSQLFSLDLFLILSLLPKLTVKWDETSRPKIGQWPAVLASYRPLLTALKVEFKCFLSPVLHFTMSLFSMESPRCISPWFLWAFLPFFLAYIWWWTIKKTNTKMLPGTNFCPRAYFASASKLTKQSLRSCCCSFVYLLLPR